jgi:formate transporter
VNRARRTGLRPASAATAVGALAQPSRPSPSAPALPSRERMLPAPTSTPAISTPPSPQTPAAALQTAQALGAAKAAAPAGKIFLLAVVAGAYIGIGALLSLLVGGAMPGLAASNPGLQRILFGLFGLPFGLTLVVAAGGELFTGNTALVTAAVLAKRASFAGLLRNWAVSFLGNFVGALLLVWLVTASGVLVGPSAATTLALARSKTSLTFSAAFARGVICNWLVCVAVWLASSAQGVASKFVAIALPVSAFVAMGFDHSVANMFIIPMAMSLRASPSLSASSFLLGNLLPVTLGNIVGGALLVAGAYHMAYGRTWES